MKSFKLYLAELDSAVGANASAATHEVDNMRKKKINTQIDLDETEGLWNTVDDRWSRRAKHHISKTEIMNAAETSEFTEGDIAIYEGKQVEVRIPLGPNGTSGIMLEGHLRMIDRSKLQPLMETISGVMGGLKPMDSLNRIMQLAGLEHTSAIAGDVVVAETAQELDEVDAAGGTMFNQLLSKNQQSPQFKNNPEAAKVATMGQILASMQGLIADIPLEQLGSVGNQIKMVPGIGAQLLDAAKLMTQPKTGSAE